MPAKDFQINANLKYNVGAQTALIHAEEQGPLCTKGVTCGHSSALMGIMKDLHAVMVLLTADVAHRQLFSLQQCHHGGLSAHQRGHHQWYLSEKRNQRASPAT